MSAGQQNRTTILNCFGRSAAVSRAARDQPQQSGNDRCREIIRPAMATCCGWSPRHSRAPLWRQASCLYGRGRASCCPEKATAFLRLSKVPSGLAVSLFPPGWKPRLYGRQDARRDVPAPRKAISLFPRRASQAAENAKWKMRGLTKLNFCARLLIIES
ncbi:MAG: hypothetical protein QOD03_1486 [Verrucomicrobiota bacterium]